MNEQRISPDQTILILNAGSSSLKIKLFSRNLDQLFCAAISEIGSNAMLSLPGSKIPVQIADSKAALEVLLRSVNDAGYSLNNVAATGHRVVHGGEKLTRPERLTPAVIAEIKACISLAPLHNPVNLTGIIALQTRFPSLPQFASFDTAFHANNPKLATTYAIPEHLRSLGIRRFGFHGLSYAGIVAHLAKDLPPRLLAMHLGNGARICAIMNGQSVATSMGYSPLEGLTMGHRSGNIDATAVLRLAQQFGIPQTDHILNHESGLTAFAGESDMQSLLERPDPSARFAVAHFCYWAARHAGSAIVAMGGVDAVTFTGGIGENAAPIREQIMQHLAFLGDLPVHVVPADEERQIARDVLSQMV